MLVKSTRLGMLEVSEQDVLSFPYGLPGFLTEKEFAYVVCANEGEKDSPFAFLQSLTEPNLTFIVVDPFAYFPDYEFELPDDIAEEFGLEMKNPPQIISIVSVPEQAEQMTANLLAPVVINRLERTAVQFVLEKSPYTTKHRLFPNGFAKAVPEEGGK